MADEGTRDLVMISALMEKANGDPVVRARLITEPEVVAKEHNIHLEPQEIQYLVKVGNLYRLVDELKTIHVGPGPIKYPAERWWARKAVANVRTIPNLYTVGYYLDMARQFEGTNVFRAQAAAR